MNYRIKYSDVELSDLNKLKELQPQGWSDISEEFRYYINSDFCCPIKTIQNNKIVGLGVSIDLPDTSWLAHIIVHPNYRKMGIGYSIVDRLLSRQFDEVNPILLIATAVGEPVYLKAGFTKVTDYIFYKRKTANGHNYSISNNIISYEPEFKSEIIALDYKIAGENRSCLFLPFLNKSKIYLENGKVTGVYIPGLGEGLIIADEENAGLELLKFKHLTENKAVLPIENKTAAKLLEKLGFEETSTGSRMVYGNHINWQPEKIFSRIGGNFG